MKKILTVIGMLIIIIISVSRIVGLQPNMTQEDIQKVVQHVTMSRNEIEDRTLQLQVREAVQRSIDENWNSDKYFVIGQSYGELDIGDELINQAVGNTFDHGDGILVIIGHREKETAGSILLYDDIVNYFPRQSPITSQTPDSLRELNRASELLNHDGYLYNDDGTTYSIIDVIYKNITSYSKLGLYYAITVLDDLGTTMRTGIKYIDAIIYLLGFTDSLPNRTHTNGQF